MKYERFPDFKDYLTHVTMVADLKNSEVGMQDIVYFAPELKRFERVSVKISGSGKGTVEKLTVKKLDLTDGVTQLKGELYMNGLPDIGNTFHRFPERRYPDQRSCRFSLCTGIKERKEY